MSSRVIRLKPHLDGYTATVLDVDGNAIGTAYKLSDDWLERDPTEPPLPKAWSFSISYVSTASCYGTVEEKDVEFVK